MRFAGVVLAVGLLVAGCGGGGDPEATPTTTAKPTPATATKTTPPTVAPPTGVPAPGDLTNVQCRADAKGVWNATGTLANDSDKMVSYQVTAFVGRADGKNAKALTKQVQNVTAHGSIKVVLAKIPAAKDATQCYVQVLRKART